MASDPSDPARRGKYADLLDPELWDYIDKVNSWYPPEIVAAPIAEQRAVYDRMCAAFHQGRPAGVTASDGLIASAAHAIPVRRYRMAGKAAAAIVVYYHGGGFVLGDLLAGTWVVEAPKVALVEDLSLRQDPVAGTFHFSPAQLDAYGIAELHKLEEVLRRDDYFALKAVAETIGRKIGAAPQAPDSRAFLTAYYGELRAHLERKLLLGNRKADKHAR